MRSFLPPLLRIKPSRRGRVVLHIGRNKAGSTTLQDLCAHESSALEAQGVDYVMFGHMSRSNGNLRGFETFEQLSEYARTVPGRRVLVSNEFMFGWPDDYTKAAATALAACHVEIVAYIRAYDAWAVSAYAEETRRGMNMRDMDAYIEWLWPRISAWPYLKMWGECFGWDRIHLRDLSPMSLHGGELCADFAKALDVTLPGWTGRSNASPHWIELELARRLTTRNGEVDWAGVERVELEPLAQIMSALVASEPMVEPLSPEQRSLLIELYNADLLRIEAAGGPRLPPAPPVVEQRRGAAPSLEQVAPRVLDAFFEQALSVEFARVHPAAAGRAARLAEELGRAPAAFA
jgi:hypothetical protein